MNPVCGCLLLGRFNGYVKLFRQKADALRYSCSCNKDYKYYVFNVEPISYEVAKAGNLLED